MLASVLKMVIVQASLSIYPSVPQHHMHSFDHSLIFMNVPDKYLLIQPNPKIVHSPSFSDICWDKKNHELSSVGVMRPLFVCPSHWLSLRLHLYNLWAHPQGTQIPPGAQCPPLPVVKKAHKSQEMEICQNSTEWRKSLNSKANSSIFREFWDCKIGIGYFIPLIRI